MIEMGGPGCAMRILASPRDVAVPRRGSMRAAAAVDADPRAQGRTGRGVGRGLLPRAPRDGGGRDG